MLLLGLFAFGCIPKKEPMAAPSDLIPEAKMTEILIDVQLIEARHQRRLIKKGQKLKDKTLGFYTALWKKHGVKEEQFKSSYDFYMESPDVMHMIWEDVLAELTNGQVEAQKEYDALNIKEVKEVDP